MIHPMQYELETARHLDCQRQAVHGRVAAEAETLDASGMPLARIVRSILGWRVLCALSVRGGAA